MTAQDEAAPAALSDQHEIPTLDEALRDQFKGRVGAYANALRNLANRLELIGREIGTRYPTGREPTATELVARMQHEIEWGLANVNFASVVTAANEHDREAGR